MRKGLTQTLMAVAVVMMAAQAMAMAPIIGDVPSPIVGDWNGTTFTNEFVYPDAFDLTNYATDQDASGNDTSGQVVWSYEIMGETPRYSINGVDPLTPAEAAALDGNPPPSAKIIAGPGANDNDTGNTKQDGSAQDSSPDTITVRNIALSPIGGPNQAPVDENAEAQLVTLYASDGTTTDMKSVWFYTDDDGLDRLSPEGPQATPVIETISDFTNWGFLSFGSVTSSRTAAQVCMTVPAPGNNLGVFSSPFGTLPLVANAVYEIRATVNSTQNTPRLVPFWDLIINNFSSAAEGMNIYGANYMFLDNTGSANAALQSRGDVDFTMWWTPSPVRTTRWNDTSETEPGPFAPSNATNRNGFIEFRVLDVATDGEGNSTNINAENALGTLCLIDVMINRYDLDDLTSFLVGTPAYEAQTITQGGLNFQSGSGNTRAFTVFASATFSNGVLTINQDDNQATMLALVEPGDYNDNLEVAAEIADNYPVALEPDKLYMLTFMLSAPTQADEDSPIDMFWVGAESATNELINLSYVTLQGWNKGMPETGAPQPYTFFFYTNYGSAAGDAWTRAWRPRMMLASNETLGGPAESNDGAIAIHAMDAEELVW